MNIQREGLGLCTRCGTPVMQAIGQPGIAGVCFGCKADGEVKTGHTVVITKETGVGLAGKVEVQQVEHEVGESSPVIKDTEAVRSAIAEKAKNKGVEPMVVNIPEPITDGEIVIKLTVEELTTNGIVTTLLQSAYDAIDAMPPFKTLRETKQAIRLQDDIHAILKQQGPYKGEPNE